MPSNKCAGSCADIYMYALTVNTDRFAIWKA